MSLFEEIYPQSRLSHGVMYFQKNNPNVLEIQWGNLKPFILDLMDFYREDSKDPLSEIKKWAYTNLPFIQDEIDESYLAYNHISGQWDAYCKRPMKNVYPCRNVNPHNFSHVDYHSKLEKIISSEMGGTVLSLKTKIKGIPATLAVSNKASFKKIIDKHMDYNDNLSLLLPDSIETNQVFVGYEDSITRLYNDFPQESSSVITIGEWFTMLQSQDGD